MVKTMLLVASAGLFFSGCSPVSLQQKDGGPLGNSRVLERDLTLREPTGNWQSVKNPPPLATSAPAQVLPSEAGSSKPAAAQAKSNNSPPQPPAAPPKPVFKALASDVNIRGVLNRWSNEVGMQKVVWEIPGDDIPVDREVDFSSDLDKSLEELMKTTSYTDQPARICVHSNKVLRVIPRTHFCDQP